MVTALIVAALALVAGAATFGGSRWPGVSSGSPPDVGRATTAPTTAAPTTTVGPPPGAAGATLTPIPASGTKLLFGMGTEADNAIGHKLVTQAPVRMLTSWYNGPGDLSWMTGWRTGTVPRSYGRGYALHLIVFNDGPEGPVDTKYGPACGRAYPLASRFAADMTRLAKTFAGARGGPPLYVTLFTEFQTYPCADNAWRADGETTNYYRALIDQYRAALRIFHQHAPNARVSLGWGGWQALYDDPSRGGGLSLFDYFAQVLRESDFQSFQAMDPRSNVRTIRTMVRELGAYGPVMVAHLQNDSAHYGADVREVLDPGFLREMISEGLFAVSFMDDKRMLADPDTFAFVRDAVRRHGRDP
ncbi:hypothetical protein GCM10009681_49080 [Luedemannella helvata]|uniref:GH26 domain-containing protein n=1 Tax=Luedemannella helvata TaxID=349315 RepID=A0ABN2L1H6_9ACTN